jgi:hypothetical protein
MKKEPLLKIFERLGAYCQEHKVLSDGELSVKIKECINSLTTAERAELEQNLGGNAEAQIFTSITSRDKISVFSPDLHTKTNYQGEVFYCLPTHGYLADELENAFLRWARIRSPSSALKDVLTEFLDRCNYAVKEETKGSRNAYCELIAVKNDKTRHKMHLFVFPSIKFVPRFMATHPELSERKEPEEEKVIVVPTERTPAPFISFVREHDVGSVTIWVVDLHKKTVNPFIGAAKDADIEDHFENPEQARSAVSVWMRKMHFVD